MKRLVFACLYFVLALILTSGATSACQEKTKEAVTTKKNQTEDDTEKSLETVDVKTKSISVYESFNGRFESTKIDEISTDFETWTELELKDVAEEGSAVTAGQVVLDLNPEKLAKAVAEAEFAVRNAEFALKDAELASQEAEKTFELDSAIARRTWENAREDFDYYKKVSAPEKLKDLDYDERTAGYRLEYSKDELDQLEQMYTEDELTEESEEIVLKRARRSVESAERSLDRALLRIKKTRGFEIPRDDARQDDSFQRAQLEFEKSKITLPIKRQRAEIALAKATFELANKVEQLEKLKSDRKKMSFEARVNGVLYYGRNVRGKWIGASGAQSRRMESGKKLPVNKVVLSVVDPNQLIIRADLDEKNLAGISKRMRGKARIAAAGDLLISVMVQSVSKIPLDNGKFDCQLIPDGLEDGQVMPGMTCKMSFLVYENNRAVVVPEASVFSDDEGVTHYVYKVIGDDVKRQVVRVGQTSGDDIEIVDGLSAGETIAKSKP